MPAKSKRQWRFLQMIRSGKKKIKGLSKKKAKEFIEATPDYKDLPESSDKKD